MYVYKLPWDESAVKFAGGETWTRVVGSAKEEARASKTLLPVVMLHGGPGLCSRYLEPMELLGQTARRLAFYDQVAALSGAPICQRCKRLSKPQNKRLGCGMRLAVRQRLQLTERPPRRRIQRGPLRRSGASPYDRSFPPLAPVRRSLMGSSVQVDAVRDSLGLGGSQRVHLFGHGWGGMLALQYVLSGAPGAASVASLTLASTAASAADATADRRAAAKTLPPATRDLLLSGVCAPPVPSLAPFSCSPPSLLSHTHDPCVQKRDDSGYAAAMDEYSRTFVSTKLPGCLTDTRAALDSPDVADAMMGPDPFTPGGVLADWSVKGRLAEVNVPVFLTRGRQGNLPPLAPFVSAGRNPPPEVSIVISLSRFTSQRARRRGGGGDDGVAGQGAAQRARPDVHGRRLLHD